MELTLTLLLIAATLSLGLLSPLAFAAFLFVRGRSDEDRATTES
ncbi:hypothetical protein [Halalkalicoccus jeotgali]|uniref:Uncharacterized protein n=1 Tax=Halalkalicoccus jeotgali (strain DSM 18796 / CECT 7217 / JCM 14584 / KCTC 4019 / B3) TaxID=795797 RepID=D8J9Q2_HALJB|nr:hypothetical protein [Halalkalicoccus jeotgali]ADJ16391.1 hypothetical protein HacjB3_15060 [Halalkalicoccus jeotgali B3]ELY37125.1 hypothetical protein C497_10288 [Halalkalicoccus jeotgali B3]